MVEGVVVGERVKTDGTGVGWDLLVEEKRKKNEERGRVGDEPREVDGRGLAEADSADVNAEFHVSVDLEGGQVDDGQTIRPRRLERNFGTRPPRILHLVLWGRRERERERERGNKVGTRNSR